MADPVSAGIAAGGQVAGAAVGSYGNKKAAQAQERSNAAALAYTKQKDARMEADALRREGLWQTQSNQWRNAANQALANWGFQGSLAPLSGYGPQTPMGSGQAVPRAGIQAGVPAAAMRRPSPYADMVRDEDSPGQADLTNQVGDWSDWRRYGLR